jgi:hypothetical protein
VAMGNGALSHGVCTSCIAVICAQLGCRHSGRIGRVCLFVKFLMATGNVLENHTIFQNDCSRAVR